MEGNFIAIKIIVVGDPDCEKTVFCKRITQRDEDICSQPTVGVDFNITTINVGDKQFRIQLWDTAGQERFRSLTKAYYRNTQGVFIVYNPALPSTFNSVPNYIKDIREFAPPNCQIMLIGNKINSSNQVLISALEGKSFAEKENLLFREVSASKNDGILDCFYALVQSISNTMTPPTGMQKVYSKSSELEPQKQPKKKKQPNKKEKPKDDRKEEESKKSANENKISISEQNFEKIVSHVRYLESLLHEDEYVQEFNFSTFECGQKKKSENDNNNSNDNFFIDEETEQSFHVVLEELEEDELYESFKIIDKRNCLVMMKKILKTDETIKFKDARNAYKEFEILNKINHPIICKTYGINLGERVSEERDDLTTIALFLEFIDYKLSTFLDNNILSNSMKVKIAVEIAFGMSYVHKIGMIHRDLSINNIKLNSKFEAKIINFGQAYFNESLQNETTIDMTKNIGESAFMSPEMLNDDDNYDNKTDVYSFGVILYKMFSGNLPQISINDMINKISPKFPSPSPSISDCCIELIKMCMLFDPEQRPSFDQILDYMQNHSFALCDNVDIEMISKRYQTLNQFSLKNYEYHHQY